MAPYVIRATAMSLREGTLSHKGYGTYGALHLWGPLKHCRGPYHLWGPVNIAVALITDGGRYHIVVALITLSEPLTLMGALNNTLP